MKILNPSINLDDFFHRVSRGGLLMLDYDGTLAPLVKERDRAYPYPGIKECLTAIASQKNTRMVIVSGRILSDLERLLNIPSVEYWGSHGLERRLPNGDVIKAELSEDLRVALDKAKEACLDNIEAEYCEIKPYGVSLHWRGMDNAKKKKSSDRVEPLWKEIASKSGLAIHPFDGGIELRLKEWNKGVVIDTLSQENPFPGATAYLGDDVADEQAFARLGSRGLKVLVREQFRPTLADIHLIPPQDLHLFLDRWKEAL